MKTIIIYILFSFIYSSEYYVATYGDSSNIGSFNYPFKSIQQAVDLMQSGDICYIRQGVYHESIKLENKNGS